MDKMIPVIMNTSFERMAVIDDYISFIWTARYYEAGDFELVVDASETNFGLFAKDNYVVRDDDDNVGIIEDIVIQHNEDDQEIMIVTGRFLSSILGRRIIAVQTTVSGAVSSCINALINQNIISPSISARQISNFVLGTYSFTEQMKAQYTGKNLLTVISTICETYGLGFKVILNDQNQFEFQLYEGTDHTYDQTENPWVIFSDTYETLMSSEYEENYQNIVSAVLVAGEGEGLDRKTAWVTDGASGLNRREIYDDSRSIRSNDGEISDAEYTKLLQEAGKESLSQFTSAFTGQVYFNNIRYKTDVNVGDLCVIEVAKWGMYLNARLVEVIESVSESGEYNIMPTFGV